MNDSTEKTIRFLPPQHIQYAAVAALSMLGLFLLVETISLLPDLGRPGTPASDVITVQGTGNASAKPDIARITWTAMQTEKTVADAQTAVTKQANSVLDYLKKQGIDDKDVKTISYNISPQYSYPRPCPAGSLCPTYYSDTSVITGYQVSQTVEVTVRDLEKVGTLLGGLGGFGVQNLYGPNFTLEDPAAPQAEARAEAIQKARTDAERLAKSLGVRLGRVVNFSEGGNYPIYAKAYGMGGTMAVDSAPTPQVPSGENDYTSNVSITYEIR